MPRLIIQILSLCLLSLGVSAFGLSADAFAIDINSASASELEGFPGVGKKTAERIIEYRDANGPFASCDDLTKVKGIGKKTLEKIKPTCTAGEGSADGSTPAPTPTPSSDTATDGKIDINSASASELKKFPGVGKKTAEKIIEYRDANGPFASCDDLTKVKGIGKKTLEKIKPTCVAVSSKE